MRQNLGQHFLINKSAIKKIIAALELKSGDTVIEIGPGKGALTFPLLKECQASGIKCRVIAIEKDPRLVESLKLKVESEKNIEIIIGDALKEIPKITKPYTLNPIPHKIVGNIPYYITGKLLRILSELENKPESVVLMVQKEVAERICAKPLRMNLLSAAIQFWAEPKILFTLKPNDFNPPPEVSSAVVKLTTNNQRPTTILTTRYYKLIRIIFKQPRKTLINNLKDGLNLSKNEVESALKTLKIAPNSRPQNLSLKDIQAIDRIL